MKILLLIDSLVRGGKERRMIELVKGLLTYPDVQLEIITFKKNIEYKEIFDLNVPLHILERQPKKDPRIFYKLYKIAKKFQPDIIHSWGTMSSIYAIPSVKMLGTKFINGNVADAPIGQTIRDSKYLRTRFTFAFSDVVIGNSKAGLNAYSAPEIKSRCVYNGFDFNRIDNLKDANKVRADLGIQTPKVVGMIGAFHNRKDFPTFIEAAKQMVSKRKDTTFLAIGDGPNRQAILESIPTAIKKYIILPGQLNDVESIINIFDVGVLCTNSKVHGEGISNSILEYMVLQKPVVATEGGGTNEIVIDGKTGFLAPYADADFLVQKLELLLDDIALAKSMGERGRRRVEQDFSLNRMKKEYIDLYYSLVV